MQDYLVFQLYAPLVSWGGQAVGQERPTDDHPSRSALLGLVAATLGINRTDEGQQQALSDSCKFGIKLYAPGLALRDFHTAQVPPANKKVHHRYTRRDELREEKLGTILSFRNYQQDNLCVVAVSSSTDEYSAQHLQQALATPQYHIYLGRKSCPPAAHLNPKVIQTKSLKQALDTYIVGEELAWLKGKVARYYWEDMEHTGLQETYHVPRYDQPISRKRRQFGSRDEYVSLRDGSDVPE